MSIKTIQEDFIQGIFGGDKDPATSHVIGDDNLTAEQRFGIYSGSVHGILGQSLGITYGVCKALVGDKFFDNMVHIFIDKHPPNTSYFSEYGDQFASFLSDFEHVKDIPYISDIAKLEWARQKVWHQQNPQDCDFSKLAELSDDQQSKLTFSLSKTLHLLQSDYRIDDIWFAHQEDSELKLEDIDIDEAVKLFIWKDEDNIKISLMSTTAEDNAYWDFLNAISTGQSLEDLAEQFGEDLGKFLNQGIQGGLIRSYQ